MRRSGCDQRVSSEYLNMVVCNKVSDVRSTTTAWVFPGQGSQFVGMGRELYAHSSAAREVFEQADAALGLNLTRLCFEGPEAELTATENAQPALLTVSVALTRMLNTLADSECAMMHPGVVAGHSLGEYAALVAGGALDFLTALRLVRRRGELMAAARQGTMAAIMGLEEDTLDYTCREVADAVASTASMDKAVVIANYNAPGQFVISGTPSAVKRVCALAKERGARRALPLKVSAAFHSPMMADAARGMAVAIENAAIHDLYIPLVGNVSAEMLLYADDIRHELVAQIVEPVRWIASVEQMAAQGFSTFVEIGPGSVLTGLIKRILPDVQTLNISKVEDIYAFAQG